MEDFCSTCGLPKTLCVCSQISKESSKVRVSLGRRKFNKIITIVTGIDDKEQIKEIGKALKRGLACGGTIKDNTIIELQGDHRKKAREILIKKGFKENLIEVV